MYAGQGKVFSLERYIQLRWLGEKQAVPSIQLVLVAAIVALVTGALSDGSHVDLKAHPESRLMPGIE